MSDVDEITLSYTFFRTGEHEAETENASTDDMELQAFAKGKGMDLSGATTREGEGGAQSEHQQLAGAPPGVALASSVAGSEHQGGSAEEDPGKKISDWTAQMAEKIGAQGQLRR